MLTLTATEAAFLSAVYDTIIPADALSPSGTDCGLVTYIDRQLAGAWGGGARMYRSGPFIPSKPEYGYQLPLTPARIFRRRHQGDERLDDQDLRQGVRPALARRPRRRADRDGAEPGRVRRTSTRKPFFEALLQSAMEGFFADPIYGGNRNKVSWRMVGYPGLPATWANKALEYRGKKVTIEPQSIADFQLRSAGPWLRN